MDKLNKQHLTGNLVRRLGRPRYRFAFEQRAA
jgi:hypothetical protein